MDGEKAIFLDLFLHIAFQLHVIVWKVSLLIIQVMENNLLCHPPICVALCRAMIQNVPV